MLTDRSGRFARFSLKPGNAHDSKELVPLIDAAPQGIGSLLADKAYDSRAIRSRLEAGGSTPVIPPKSNAVNPPPCDMDAYKARHLVENMFADLKQFRGIATRYCKLASTFEEILSLVFWYLNTKKGHRRPSPHPVAA